MSKGFENLSKVECIPVAKALIANARSMQQSSKAVAKKGQYGPARSLLILGAEEFIKGALLYLTGKGVRVLRVKEARKALNNHKERHEAAIVLKLLKVIEGLMGLQGFKSDPQKKASWLQKVSFYLKQLIDLVSLFGEVGDDVLWWDSANDFKNSGFYVDYKNQLLLPSAINEEDYKKALSKVNDLINRFRIVMILFDRYLSPKEATEFVKSLNDALELHNSYVSKPKPTTV